jgi:nucleotide-binding universal stress UspA family protein
MMFHNVLVPVDGSSPSNAAVDLAFHVAADEGARITFAHVVEVSKLVAMAAPSSIDPSAAVQAAEEAGQAILDRCKKKAAGTKVTVTTSLLEGDAVQSLLALVSERDIDLIILGSHGRSGISRALLGSIAEGVLRRSPIPVLVTHAPRS